MFLSGIAKRFLIVKVEAGKQLLKGLYLSVCTTLISSLIVVDVFSIGTIEEHKMSKTTQFE